MPNHSALLSSEAIEEIKNLLKVRRSENPTEKMMWVSGVIEAQILSRLADCSEWEASRPCALGSWGKHQLTSISDVDVLFLGPEPAVLKVVEHARSKGIELRYRTPMDPLDWTVGVEEFDINSLIFGRPLFAADIAPFDEQLAKIKKSKHVYKRIVGAIKTDRMKRHSLHMGVAGHLEPHLKTGPGGARDGVHFFVLNFFRPTDSDLVEEMNRQANFVIHCRQVLALTGEREHLRAQEQIDLCDLLGFENSKALMKAVVSSLNFVKLISDEQHSALNSGKAFERSPIKLTSKEIQSWKPNKLPVEKLSKAFFDSNATEFFPNWENIYGLVKHDQYHRFSVESHIFKAVNLLCEWSKRTPVFIKRFTKSFGQEDWKILFWAIFFHDIGKGSDEDHSTLGKRLAAEFFVKHKFSRATAEHIAWLVENHLLLSTFAFRHNHHSSQVVAELKKRGVEGVRLNWLLIVTVIDIMATNPSAWSTWKENLLFKLAEHLQSKSVNRLGELIKIAEKKRVSDLDEFLEHVNETVLLDLDPNVLMTDYMEVLKSTKDLPVKLFLDSKNQIWVRFHKKEDRPGVFLEFIQKIVTTGSQIRHSVVMTLASGVYDWFHIRTSKDVETLSRIFKSLQNSSAPRSDRFHAVKFQKVELVTQTESEAVVSFRGIDQRGALMVAAQQLFDHGLEIKWAKVNTFGSQIEDVFGIKLKDGLATKVEEIHAKVCSTHSPTPNKMAISLD